MAMTEVKSCKTCIDGQLARRLEVRFPWLAKDSADSVSGSDTVEQLIAFHASPSVASSAHMQAPAAANQGAEAWQPILL